MSGQNVGIIQVSHKYWHSCHMSSMVKASTEWFSKVTFPCSNSFSSQLLSDTGSILFIMMNCCLHTQTNGTAFASFSSISGASTLDYPFFVLHDLGTYFQSVLKMESLRNKNTWLSFTVHCVTLMNRFPQRPIPLPPGKNLIWVVSS